MSSKRRARLYELVQRREGTRRWQRAPFGEGMAKEAAVRVYQSRLLNAAMGGLVDADGRGVEMRLRAVGR